MRSQVMEAQTTADLKVLAFLAARAAKQKQATEAQLEACVIKAPQDGVVMYYVPEAARGGGGAIVAQGEPVRAGQKLLRILDLKRLSVRVRIPEALVADVRVGQRATVRIDAFPQRSLRGLVQDVAKTVDPHDWLAGRAVHVVLVELTEPFSGLVPGMTAEVRIEGTRKRGVLRVPAEAIVRSGLETVCYVQADKLLQERRVKTGARGDALVEITEGLREAEQVLWNPYLVAKRAGQP
jgi:RND family efflux transporter MFP subunit